MELNELLEKRAAEIEDSLQPWVKPHLGPGEKLKVTLEVVYDAELDKNQLLDLKVEDFFTYERMLTAGMDHNTATRVRTVFSHEAESFAEKEGSDLTLRRFLKNYTTGMVRREIPGVGAKTYKLILKVLDKEGFNLRGPVLDSGI
jgi:hypothetical protein